MHWLDEGIVLSSRPHGETSAIVELLTREHGRHLGLVRGGRSKRLRPALQIGNLVSAEWRARLSEHLGSYSIELSQPNAARLLDDRMALSALETLAGLSRLLPERDPHKSLFEATLLVLSSLGEEDHWPALLVRWEVGLLEELGFGLDLQSCAANGTEKDLRYVSPKSGRAVSLTEGEPYKDRLLPLPAFLTVEGMSNGADTGDVIRGLELTGHFLEKHIWNPRGILPPAGRGRLLKLLEKWS